MAATLFLLLAASLAHDCRVMGDGIRPRFRLANGTLLEDDAEIVLECGTPFELYCTGEARYLKIRSPSGANDLETFVNQTAVKFFDEYLKCGSHDYFCEDTETHLGTFLTVEGESLPVVSNFICTIESFNYMYCDWQTKNEKVIDASLFYVYTGEPVRWCKWQHQTITLTRRCIWDSVNSQMEIYLKQQKTLTFLMKACVRLGCSEQTFHVTIMATVKLSKPVLEVSRRITSHSVTLTNRIYYNKMMRDFFKSHRLTPNTLDCKITCLQAGLYQFRLNHTIAIDLNHWDFKITIQLPCPDTFYDVKVAVKPSTSVGEEYWSDEAEVSFITKPAPERPGAPAADPRCANQNYKITPEVMLADLNRFRSRMKGELRALRERVQALRLKADQDEQTKGFVEIVGPEDFY